MTASGERKFDAEGKRKLIDACLQPGASIAGLALKAGVNANQLHKWIQLRESTNAATATASVEPLPSAFVPVVAVGEVAPVRMNPEPVSVRRSSHGYESAKTATPARLSAQLPNGVTLQLDPLARAVFAFHNRKRDRVKLLLYDRAGFLLLMKRLEADYFVWPRRQQAVIELTAEQLHLLLAASMSMRYAVILRGNTATRAEWRHRRYPAKGPPSARCESTTARPAVTNLRKPIRR